MKNLVNWMCLLSIMFLIIQVMVYISGEVISDINSLESSNKKRNNKSRSVGNTEIKKKVV